MCCVTAGRRCFGTASLPSPSPTPPPHTGACASLPHAPEPSRRGGKASAIYSDTTGSGPFIQQLRNINVRWRSSVAVKFARDVGSGCEAAQPTSTERVVRHSLPVQSNWNTASVEAGSGQAKRVPSFCSQLYMACRYLRKQPTSPPWSSTQLLALPRRWCMARSTLHGVGKLLQHCCLQLVPGC